MLKETYVIFNGQNDMFLGYTLSSNFTIDGTYYTTPIWVPSYTTMFGVYADIDYVQVADIHDASSLSDRCIVVSELYTLLNNVENAVHVYVVPVKLVYDKDNRLLNYRIDELEIDFLRMSSFSEFCGVGRDIGLVENYWEDTYYIAAKPI